MSGHLHTVESEDSVQLVQHGVVLSNLSRQPGPTHSLFDVIASVVYALAPGPRIAVLGFAAGGIVSPLRAMHSDHQIDGVDLESEGFDIFRRACPFPKQDVRFHQADAVSWLRSQRRRFDLILEDLSVPNDGDVIKPPFSINEIPRLASTRLRERGVYVANLFPPMNPGWKASLAATAQPFSSAHVVLLDEYDNRLLIAGSHGCTARDLGHRINCALDILQSNQTDKLAVRTVDPSASPR